MILALLVVLLVVGVIVSTAESVTEIDLQTGELRTKTLIVGVPIRTQPRETRFSSFVKANLAYVHVRDWRKEYGKALFEHDVSEYPCSGADTACERAMDVIGLENIPQNARKEIAQILLSYLAKGQIHEMYDKVDQFWKKYGEMENTSSTKN